MEGLKRTKPEFLDSSPPDFFSPFYKETKTEENRNPGQVYFNYINKPIGGENSATIRGKRPSRGERHQKIENARETFTNFFKMINGQIKNEEFITYRDILTNKLKVFQEIPTLNQVVFVHKEYLSGEKTRKNYKNKNWNDHEIKILLFMVIIYSCQLEKRHPEDELSDKIWSEIAGIFTNKTGQTCKFKFNGLLRSHPTVMSWTPEEDEFLMQIISEIKQEDQNRIKWSEIAIKLNKKVNNNNLIRVGKHCRERWNNHLNPFLKKGSWTVEEDIMLLEQSLIAGKKWAKISRNLPGRNENSVKNRFITLTKQIKFKKTSKNSDILNKDSLFTQEIKKMIEGLRSQIRNESLNIGNLEITTPESSPSPEKKSPLKEHKNDSFRKPSLPKENIQDYNQNMANAEYLQNLMLSNYSYNNYLLYMQFLNSRIMTPQVDLERQYQEIHRELNTLSQKDLYLSNLHFSTTSSEYDRRGSGLTDRRGSGFTSKDPGSKRNSNSFVSLYMTPSLSVLEVEEPQPPTKISKDLSDLETSTNADSNKNIGNDEKNGNSMNATQSKTKNKNKNLMALVVDEMNERKEQGNVIPEEGISMTQSCNKSLPPLTPPLMSFSHLSPMALNQIPQEYFRFSPFIDHNGFEKRVITPVSCGLRIDEEIMAENSQQ